MQEYPSCASLGAISNKSVIFFVRNAEILTTCQLFGGLALCNQEKNDPVATCLTLHIAVQPSTKWILHRPNTSPFSLCSDNGVSQSIQYQFIYCSHVLKCITSPETAGKQQLITRGFCQCEYTGIRQTQVPKRGCQTQNCSLGFLYSMHL